MASTKETYLQFLKRKGISAEDIGMSFKLSNGQIVFFSLDEEFNDEGKLGEKIIACSYDLTHNLTHKFLKK